MGFTKRSLAACAAVLMTASIAGAQENPTVIRLRTAPHGNEARYRVREQLAGVDFPNDAVGKTSRVDGSITVAADGTVLVSDSRFTIDLTSLTSDRDRRDNYLRRNTLQTEQHPTAVFVPKVIRGIKLPMPNNGEVKFQMVGDLSIKGVTKEVTWDVSAKSERGSITGQAKTRFTFADMQLEKPRVRSVLTVDDDITLEYDFLLVPAR
jgi:polyisoprenoid-binding protein YceI